MFHNLAHIPARFGENIMLTRPLSHKLCKVVLSTLTVVLWPKFGHSTTLNNKGYKSHKEMGMFHNLAHIPARFGENIMLTRPLSHEVCKMVLSVSFPILSHTLTVVLWPKFGHSTTLNNKGYKAHKEMGHVS